MRVGQEIVFLRARGKHTSFRSRRAVLSFASTMPASEFLNLSFQHRGPFLRTNVLVKVEEVIRIVM